MASSSRTPGLAQLWEDRGALEDVQLEQLALLNRMVTSTTISTQEILADQFQPPRTGVRDMDSLGATRTDLSDLYGQYDEALGYLERKDESTYREHLEALRGYQQTCASLRREAEDALESLDSVKKSHISVSTKTGALHETCDSLLHEQERLIYVADSIRDNLEHFEQYDTAAKALADPSFTAESPEFLPLLRRLDESIEYLASNPNFRDSGLYLIRFRQLHSRALSVIRDSFVLSMKRLAESGLLANKPPAQDFDRDPLVGVETALHHVRFRAAAGPLRALVAQLEQRARTTNDSRGDYTVPTASRDAAVLLADCRACYHQHRHGLLWETVRAAVRQHSTNQDVSGLLRSGGSFMMRLCHLEFQLHSNFFEHATTTTSSVSTAPGGTTAPISGPVDTATASDLSAAHQALCSPLYEECRTRLIHMNDVDELYEAVYILKSEILGQEMPRRGAGAAAFEPVALRILHDAQERLIYRAQMCISDEIKGYTPSREDLDYPGCLQPRPTDASGTAQTPRVHDQHTWYPTVEKTLLLLSKLYRAVENRVFESMAQEALLVCTTSLLTASRAVARKSDTSALDGALFLVRHLLILREQIEPFDTSFTATEKYLDFSGVRLAWSLFDISSLFSLSTEHNALLGFVNRGVPRVAESSVDSKQVLERELKDACDLLIQMLTRMTIRPLMDIITKAEAHISKQDQAPTPGKRPRNLPSPEKLLMVVADAITAVSSPGPDPSQALLSKYVSAVRVYIPRPGTADVLLRPVEDRILQTFGQLRTVLPQLYTESERTPVEQLISADPTQFTHGLHEILSLQPPPSTESAPMNSEAAVTPESDSHEAPVGAGTGLEGEPIKPTADS